jgi:hypothetical protein
MHDSYQKFALTRLAKIGMPHLVKISNHLSPLDQYRLQEALQLLVGAKQESHCPLISEINLQQQRLSAFKTHCQEHSPNQNLFLWDDRALISENI